MLSREGFRRGCLVSHQVKPPPRCWLHLQMKSMLWSPELRRASRRSWHTALYHGNKKPIEPLSRVGVQQGKEGFTSFQLVHPHWRLSHDSWVLVLWSWWSRESCSWIRGSHSTARQVSLKLLFLKVTGLYCDQTFKFSVISKPTGGCQILKKPWAPVWWWLSTPLLSLTSRRKGQSCLGGIAGWKELCFADPRKFCFMKICNAKWRS